MIRKVLTGALLAALVFPVLIPYAWAVYYPAAWHVWAEGGRLLELLGNSVALAGLTCLIAVPLGTIFALSFLSPLRSLVSALFALAIIIPLPLLTISGTIVGRSGPGPWNPFSTGLFSATIVHVWFAVPWVVWIVGASLVREDRTLGDEIRLSTTRAGQLWELIRRANRAIAFATIIVAVQCSCEIVATDMARLRTFAEETYLQFVAPGSSESSSADLALAQAVIATLPVLILLSAGLVGLGSREVVNEGIHTAEVRAVSPTENRMLAYVAAIGAAVWVGIPVFALVQRASSFAALENSVRNNGSLLVDSVFGSMIVGIFVTVFALSLAFLTRHHPRFRVAIALLAAVAWSVPGPVVGVGLQKTIGWFIDKGIGGQLGRLWLYDGPSFLPVWWAHAMRAWPIALAVLWPLVRAFPRGFTASTSMDSNSTLALVKYDVLPNCAPAIAASVFLVTVISGAEVSASGSSSVATPGGQTYMHQLFAQMHFGVTPDLAGMGLVYIAAMFVVCSASLFLIRLIGRAA
ncbi:MAG: hypothetical protein ACJ8C4_16700 [Gemmataceae bacterium]